MERKGNMGNIGEVVLLSVEDDEQMMHHFAGKYRSDGQGLKSVVADYKKKRGSGPGSTVDGRIRILKREKDLRLKRKVDGRIRFLRRPDGLRPKRKVDGRIRILKREKDLMLKRKVDGRIRILRRENLK